MLVKAPQLCIVSALHCTQRLTISMLQEYRAHH
jgi:hypothetical protein